MHSLKIQTWISTQEIFRKVQTSNVRKNDIKIKCNCLFQTEKIKKMQKKIPLGFPGGFCKVLY